MTGQQARELVELIAAGHPKGRDLPPATLAVYALQLADLDYDEARRAVVAVQRSSEYVPTIADIYRELKQGRVAQLGLVPWAVALAAVYAGDDPGPAGREVRRLMGGAYAIRQEPASRIEARFRALYESIVERMVGEVDRQLAPALSGGPGPRELSEGGR